MDIRWEVSLIVLIVCMVMVLSFPGMNYASGAGFQEIENPPEGIVGTTSPVEEAFAKPMSDYEDRLLVQAKKNNLYEPMGTERGRSDIKPDAENISDGSQAKPGEADIPVAPLGIYGHVTRNGANASSEDLELRYYDGASWTTRATTTTAADGSYNFLGVPNLTSGQQYYVRFWNDEAASNRIYFWGTAVLTAYNGEDVHIGDFDIADITKVAPGDGATTSLPKTFLWIMRSGVPTDNYELNLFNPADSDIYWYMTVGHIASFVLNCVPANFSTGTTYGWYMGVYSPDGGYGYTTFREVTFNSNPACNGIRGHVSVNGANASEVGLELGFWDGSEWSTRSNAVSGADGNFNFVNVPTLDSGEEYQVRFSNYDGVAGQLWRWWVKLIEAYTGGVDENVGDFDIADIVLVQPVHLASISLPSTFQWTPRPATTSDSYELDLFDPNSGDTRWWAELGYIGNYSLGCFWPDVQSGEEYGWDVWAIAPDGGYGLSYNYRLVTLTDGPECTHNYLPLAIR
jgi:hypothetical protein